MAFRQISEGTFLRNEATKAQLTGREPSGFRPRPIRSRHGAAAALAHVSAAFAVLALPREEEPQIIVPMIDVMVEMPGASPQEIEQRITRPMEKLLWEVPGVEYLYSTSSTGRSTVIVTRLPSWGAAIE